MQFQVDEAVLMIRDAIMDTEFPCDHLSILLPGNSMTLGSATDLLSLMWGDDDSVPSVAR